VELNIPDLEELSDNKRRVRPYVDEYKLKDGRRIFLLGEGRLLNLAAAEGHPPTVMDMSFANQALAAEFIINKGKELEVKVHPVPEAIDKRIAKLKLESMDIQIDELTAEQEEYLGSWKMGT
jgi:adenosylhomocysteinase